MEIREINDGYINIGYDIKCSCGCENLLRIFNDDEELEIVLINLNPSTKNKNCFKISEKDFTKITNLTKKLSSQKHPEVHK